MLVDKDGQPLPSVKSEKSLPFRLYYAKKPGLAAVKAYYAFNRSNKPAQHDLNLNGVDEIRKEANKVCANEEDLENYMTKVKQAKAEPSKIIHLRRPDENKIRTYTVGYERVIKPNKHEIAKGIVKVAFAKLISDEQV